MKDRKPVREVWVIVAFKAGFAPAWDKDLGPQTLSFLAQLEIRVEK